MVECKVAGWWGYGCRRIVGCAAIEDVDGLTDSDSIGKYFKQLQEGEIPPEEFLERIAGFAGGFEGCPLKAVIYKRIEEMKIFAQSMISNR